MITARPYVLVFRHLIRARIDVLTDDLWCMLTTAAYTPAAADEWVSTPAAAEVVGSGYQAGGVQLTGVSADTDLDTGITAVTCDPPMWPEPAFTTARRAVFYADSGDPATSPLLSHVDFGAAVDTAGAPLTLTVSAAGFFQLFPQP